MLGLQLLQLLHHCCSKVSLQLLILQHYPHIPTPLLLQLRQLLLVYCCQSSPAFALLLHGSCRCCCCGLTMLCDHLLCAGAVKGGLLLLGRCCKGPVQAAELLW
jgi:hypothetical protein